MSGPNRPTEWVYARTYGRLFLVNLRDALVAEWRLALAVAGELERRSTVRRGEGRG